ncbi:MAG: class I SAM-dependent methyltransferase [Chloroflexi bacterium]|nr:class I SAM-dependent methyltransferase [Chloroflexota bacterium]
MTAEQPSTTAAREAAYDRFAETYRDWWAPVIAPSAVRLLDRLDGLLPADRPSTVVDIGAGTGSLALAALERWPSVEVIGVDPSRRMLDLAADAARDRRLDERLRVEVGEAAHLPLPDASVDAAMSSFVIQLIPSRAAAVREALRVLRPGGGFACVTWRAEDDAFEPESAFDRALEELRVEPPPSGGGNGTRPYASPASAAADLRRAGFTSVRAREEWLEHRFTPRSYVDVLEHWIEDETFLALEEPMRRRLRAATLRRLHRLDPESLVWRRPLVSVVGRRPADENQPRELPGFIGLGRGPGDVAERAEEILERERPAAIAPQATLPEVCYLIGSRLGSAREADFLPGA